MLLRWLWWRINAWSEISVVLVSLLGTQLIELSTDLAFPFSLVAVVAISLPVAFAVTFLTSPEDSEVLQAFYRRVRPVGAWEPVTQALGLPARPLGWRPWLDVAAATIGIYAAIAGTGSMLFGQIRTGLAAWAVAMLLLWLAVQGAVRVNPDSEVRD